jgi:hypothetical protein
VSPTPVSNHRRDTVCGFGKAVETCSFLGMGPEGWCCFKASNFEGMIMERRFLGTIKAMGDNCSGPPDFTIETPKKAEVEAHA